jgi:hypothetical protein
MRGVVVPEASHVLEMRYRPRSLQLGCPISAVVIVVFAVSLHIFREKGTGV